MINIDQDIIQIQVMKSNMANIIHILKKSIVKAPYIKSK